MNTSKKRPARWGEPYSDAELRLILSKPPTKPSIAELAAALMRTEDAIRIIFLTANMRERDLSPKMKSVKTWKQIRRVAGELGYLAVGNREMARLAPGCPECKTRKRPIPVLYGYPTDEAQQAELRRELKLGGCSFTAASPNWHCVACGTDFRADLVGEP